MPLSHPSPPVSRRRARRPLLAPTLGSIEGALPFAMIRLLDAWTSLEGPWKTRGSGPGEWVPRTSNCWPSYGEPPPPRWRDI